MRVGKGRSGLLARSRGVFVSMERVVPDFHFL